MKKNHKITNNLHSRLFNKFSNRTHKRNKPRLYKRGGIRL